MTPIPDRPPSPDVELVLPADVAAVLVAILSTVLAADLFRYHDLADSDRVGTIAVLREKLA